MANPEREESQGAEAPREKSNSPKGRVPEEVLDSILLDRTLEEHLRMNPPGPGRKGKSDQGSQPRPDPQKTPMTIGEQKAENRAAKAEMREETNERLAEMRKEHNEAIGEIKELKGSIDQAFKDQSSERREFRAELRGDMREVKEGNKWASRFVNLGIAVIAALVGLLALAFSKGIGLF